MWFIIKGNRSSREIPSNQSWYLPSLFLLCESYFEQNENELAIECLDRIKNIDPENPKYLFFSLKLLLKMAT